MSFLHRHRSHGPESSDSSTSLPFPPAVENIRNSRTKPTPGGNSKALGPSRLIRRVSTLFSNRKKRPPTVTIIPISIHAPANPRWRITTDCDSITESDEDEDDIRRPSGLGRAVSISSGRSLPPSPFTVIDEDSPFNIALNTGYERIRAISSPNLLSSMNTGNRSVFSRRPSIIVGPLQDPPPPPKPVPQIPQEVLVSILALLPRHYVACLALTSRSFYSAARSVFYDSLDLRTLQPIQVEGLITLLAYRQDLTDLIQKFECHKWPTFFPPHSGISRIHTPSFSPSLTAMFTIAFQNMYHVTSLVLPSFNPMILRHYKASALKELTFLNYTLSSTEVTQLFAWLDGQTSITHLLFPNLQDDTPKTPDTDTPSDNPFPTPDPLNTNGLVTSVHAVVPSSSPASPATSSITSTTPKSPFNSLMLLPALSTLVATPSIVLSLTSPGSPSRPLKNVTLSINQTLYTGLRPAALIGTLQGITHLGLRFGPAMDRRTIGKVLTASAALSSNSMNSPDTGQVLQALEIELTDSTDGTDQILYKIINVVLPRYNGLITLRISHGFLSDPRSELVASAQSEHDNARLKLWPKLCPSLQSVELLSGAKWKRV